MCFERTASRLMSPEVTVFCPGSAAAAPVIAATSATRATTSAGEGRATLAFFIRAKNRTPRRRELRSRATQLPRRNGGTSISSSETVSSRRSRSPSPST